MTEIRFVFYTIIALQIALLGAFVWDAVTFEERVGDAVHDAMFINDGNT